MGQVCCAAPGSNNSETATAHGLFTEGFKIHGMTVSANVLGPSIFVTDIGKGGLELCDIMKGMQKTPEFLKKNPFHHIPTFEDPGGFCIGESGAMLRYVAANMAKEYYPMDAKLRGRIDWAVAAFTADVYNKWGARLYPVLDFKSEPEDQEKANKELKNSLDNFCKSFIGSSKFIAGDTLSIADYKALPYLFTMSHPVAVKKSGCKLSARLEQYVKDIMALSPGSAILKSAGGWSLDEYLNTKTDYPDYKGEVLVCGEGSCTAIKKGPAKAGETRAKIHGMPVSSNTVSCVLIAMDAGIGAMEMCDLMSGGQMTLAFLAKNPFHQIPTFEDSDGFCLAESTAILRYIAANYKPELYPADPKERALIDWAMDAFSADIYPSIAYGVFYPIFGFSGPPADQKAENEKCLELLKNYEMAFLQDKKFVCGDKVSIAEYKAVPFLYAAAQPVMKKKTGFELPPRMQKYMEDSIKEMKSSGFMESCGGYSLKEYAASKDV